MNRIELMDNKNCCGCGACQAACPKHAIRMKEDDCGFRYPVVDDAVCVDCGLCKKVCMYQKTVDFHPIGEAYAAASKKEPVLRASASGGLFYEIAKSFLKEDGVVYGCAFTKDDRGIAAAHIRVDEECSLKKLQGSKYVQSSMEASFGKVKKDLMDGRRVLFSGTPCQVGALYQFLGQRHTEHLYTIDIICHGVPNMTFLQDYLKLQENRLRGRITDISFRDKEEGWGLKGSLIYENGKGQKLKKKMPLQGFSYYKMFLDSDTYRDSCYDCLYTKKERVSDVTLGDYWGIEKIHPEFPAAVEKGISCLLVNSCKGSALLDMVSDRLYLTRSQVDFVAKENQQLKHSSRPAGYREQIWQDYKKGGYAAVEKNYYKRFGKKSLLYKVWNYLPGSKIDEKNSVVGKNEKCD